MTEIAGIIGTQGLETSNTAAMAEEMYGSAVKLRHYDSFPGVFGGLAAGDVGRLVVAYRNPNIEDNFNYVGPTFREIHANGHNSWIDREGIRWIEHKLMVLPGTDPADITTFVTQKEAFDQCEETINDRYPGVHRLPVKDTALAARDLKERTHAAIATEEAAERYGLEIIDHKIQDIEQNPTAFLSWTTHKQGMREWQDTPVHTEDTTLMIVGVPDSGKSGALDVALRILGAHDISLSDLHSVLVPKSAMKKEFFIRADMGYGEDAMQAALRAIRMQRCPVSVLGSFVHAELPPYEPKQAA